jgi:selenocysteine-specific elongation factor
VSFVDVPGHERFVRNMLAGAHGIDAVVLVVAADESVMPQTREHFHICRLLGIERGVVALTKCDVADADSQALAEMEVRELVAGSALEGAEIVRVSARTGEGLDALRAALERVGERMGPRPATGLLRLPVDRVFTLHGFGTVVTGTLVSGAIGVGEELEALPSGRRARARGIQVHGAAVERAEAGSRTAVNLAGVEVTDLERGDVLGRPGTLRSTFILDVELALLPGEKPLRDQARLRVHLASAERLARVRLPGRPALEPGGRTLAQLRLEAPAVAGRGDRLVLRAYSPPTTVGGAVVLDPRPAGRRISTEAARLRLEALRAATIAEAARLFVAESGAHGVALPELAARVTCPEAELRAALGADAEVDLLGRDPAVAVARATLASLAAASLEALRSFHAENPLQPAMPLEKLRGRVFSQAAPAVVDEVLGRLAAEGRLRAAADAVALPTHAVTLKPEEAELREALLAALDAAGYAGLGVEEAARTTRRDSRSVERLLRLLRTQGELDAVGESQFVLRRHLEALKQEVRRRWTPGARLDVAGVKELTGLSRKFVIPLLEYLDREKVTRRSGADRIVMGSSS